MQSWFSSSGEDQQQEKPSSSLLADWNSYAAKSDVNEYTNGLGSFGSFDLEAAARSANDTVSGTFNVQVLKERLPFTLGFIGSMVGTLYVSMVWHSYVLSVLFSVIQVLALVYYAISYFPGGSAGLKFLSSSLASSVMRLFGR
ncbi:uncharacterized protein LOC133669810 [Populus nigra]|uniref:uncharacterized protein LOC133669810 n=1 Tax=Populus nigra TaxID=3691 RepID=UPI002B2795B4|nr:uncharacterized protein LOC133669810 [Populus nigra]